MKCDKCGAEMFKANMTGNYLYPVMLTNKKKGIFECEKRSGVLCYICPECGYIELYAENPKGLKIDWLIITSEKEILNYIISCVSTGARAFQVIENTKTDLSFNGLEIDDINRS